MKKILLIGATIALVCGCGNAATQNDTDVESNKAVEVLVDQTNLVPVDSTTVRYLEALPSEYKEEDSFGLILSYGGTSMIVNTWQMPDGDWLILSHWSEEEDSPYFIVDDEGNEIEVEYHDPFDRQPYPVVHNPKFSFSTRNYGGETIPFYTSADGQKVACTTNYKEISLDVLGVDTKTRRLLVQSNPSDWCWSEPKDEFDAEYHHPFVELRGWIDEEWVCANTVTTCP